MAAAMCVGTHSVVVAAIGVFAWGAGVALGVSASGAVVGGLSVLAGAYGVLYRSAPARLRSAEPEA